MSEASGQTLSVVDSPASPSASRGWDRRSKTTDGSGPSFSASSPRYDPHTSSWRTSQDSLFAASETYSGDWPSSGMTRSGRAYPLPRLVRRTFGGGCFLLPTPAAQPAGWKNLPILDGRGCYPEHFNQRLYHAETGRLIQRGVWQVICLTAGLALPTAPPLNPCFLEWMMGFPLDWTASE